MTKLAELQRNFMRDCLSGKLTNEKTLLAKDIDTKSISASGLMGIYQNSAIGNIINSMKLTYPVIEKLVGEQFFRATCRKFILSHWPKTANMDDYGGEFSDFLSEFEHVKQLTYLEDIARLEWLFHQSTLANDAAVTDWTLLAKVAENEVLNLKFTLAPAVSLIRSHFPVDKIWQMNQINNTEEVTLDFDDNEMFLLLYRNDLKIEMLAITAEEFLLLKSFHLGLSFEKAIENATKFDVNLSIDDMIKIHIELGVISGFLTL